MGRKEGRTLFFWVFAYSASISAIFSRTPIAEMELGRQRAQRRSGVPFGQLWKLRLTDLDLTD